MNLPTLSLHEYCSHLWAPAELFDRVPASKDAPEQARPHKRRKLLAALSSRGGSLQRGGDGLSDEELEYGLQQAEIRNFGYSWMIPTGRHTSQEDEADAFLDPAEHDEPSPGPRPTMTHPLLGAAAAARPTRNGERQQEQPAPQPASTDEAQDLDADVQDMDASADQSGSNANASASREEERGETTEEE